MATITNGVIEYSQEWPAGEVKKLHLEDGKVLPFATATVTIDQYGAHVGDPIGSNPIPENIEYNKRVSECQTKNGEF